MEDRRLRREDMRYNESIERANKKDRRLAMQSLAGGLPHWVQPLPSDYWL